MAQNENEKYKVGDAVTNSDNGVALFGPVLGVITRVAGSRISVLWSDGCTGTYKPADLKRTGRQVAKVEFLNDGMIISMVS